MKAVWKFQLFLTGDQTVLMPVGAEILHVAEQGGLVLCVWALVNPDLEQEARRFLIVGTGQREGPGNADHYIGSVLAQSGNVWHVFEERNG